MSDTPQASGQRAPRRSPLRWLSDLRFALWRSLARRWLRPRGLGHEAVQAAQGQTLCYVLPHRSTGDLLVLDQVCTELGLPAPRDPMVQVLEDQAYLHLSRPAGGLFKRQTMRRYPRRLVRLLDTLAQHPEQEVLLVPVSIFWSRAPRRERSLLRLLLAERWAVTGRIRKFLSALFNRHEILLQFGQPMALRPLMDLHLEENRTIRRVARLLRAHFRQQRTAVIGPDLSHRRTLVNQLLRSPPVRTAIEAEAARTDTPAAKVRNRARRNAMEIASDVSFRVVRFFDILLTWLWQQLYDGVRVEGMERIKPWAESHQLVYVPCHRSHMDYLLLSYVLYYNGLSLPHIAAGRNLNLPVVGGLLRRCGAFFMRRSFRDDPVYSAVFNEYLYMMCRRGHAVEYFIEGGRSRTGRLLPARGGMLAMTLRSVLRDIGRPLAFVPVYFGYEKVPEIRSYVGELKGQAKKQESLGGLVRSARRTLSQSFGQVQVCFGQPIDLEQFLDTAAPQWRGDMATGRSLPPNPPWLKGAVDALGRRILAEINAVAAINPVNLVSLVLLSTPRQALVEADLKAQIGLYLHLLREGPGCSSLVLPPLAAGQVVAHVEAMGLLSRQAHPMGDILGIEGADRVLLTWFRNNAIHTLALPSLIASLVRGHGSITRARLRRLCLAVYPYLAREFFLPADGAETTRIHRWLALLAEQGLISQDGQGEDCRVSAAPHASLGYNRLLLLGRLISQTLERYYLVIATLDARGSGQVTRDDLQAHCQQMAQRLARLHDLDAPEFFDRNLFSGFVDELHRQELLQQDNQGRVVFDTRLDRILKDAALVVDSDVRQAVLGARMPAVSGTSAVTPPRSSAA